MVDSVLLTLPYVAIIIANVLYLYAHGFQPLSFEPELLLYNFLFFLAVGVFLFFHASYLLNKWIVKGEGDKKLKLKEFIAKLRGYWNFGISRFTIGNETFMIKVYCYLCLWTMINYVIPPVLIGLLGAIYAQFKKPIDQQINAISESQMGINIKTYFQQTIQSILNGLPRYSDFERLHSE